MTMLLQKIPQVDVGGSDLLGEMLIFCALDAFLCLVQRRIDIATEYQDDVDVVQVEGILQVEVGKFQRLPWREGASWR